MVKKRKSEGLTFKQLKWVGIFILLSAFDILFNASGVLIPVIGGIAETTQETINEAIQIIIFSYFVLERG